MSNQFVIYKERQATLENLKPTRRYWDRRQKNWTKWFSKSCCYPTIKGANRTLDNLVKFYLGEGIVMGTTSREKAVK